MSVSDQITDTLEGAIPFIVVFLLWSIIVGVSYKAVVEAMPPVPGAEPWIYLGVYLMPLIGYLGHTLQLAISTQPDN